MFDIQIIILYNILYMSVMLFVDKNIPDYDIFIKHVKVDIKHDFLHYPQVNRIGFIWHSDNNSIMPFGKNRYNKSNIFTEEFINYLSKYKEPLVVDLISCNVGSKLLENELDNIIKLLPNIKINYSNSIIGNSPKGSWILESSRENIQNIYFNDTIIEYNHVFGLPNDGDLGSNFSYTDVANVRTFTLNTNFTTNTWTRVDITYSDNVHQVIIDGNNKTITINQANFDGLFLAGNYFSGNNKPTIIKNLFIKASVNINVAIAAVNGYNQFENCHLELFGNINNNGGGLCNNNDTNDFMKLDLTNCSCKIFGKLGTNAGPLIGYIFYNSNSIYNITNCSSIVSDSNSDPIIGNTITLASGAGVFVGSGISNNVNITSSYCLFNGSMSPGTGIISGKYLGSNGTLTINKFYAVSYITYAINGSTVGQAGNYSYNLSSYFGGNLPTTFNISNVNVLNLGVNLTNVYCQIGTLYPTLTNFSKFTDYTTFAATAHTTGAKIGTDTYIITFDINRTFYSFTTDYKNDWDWTIDTGESIYILKGVSKLSTFTINNQTLSITPFTPTLPTILVGNGTITYSSNNQAIATVDINTGEITMLTIGTVIITATLSGTDYYVQILSNAEFTINNDLPCLTIDTKVLTPNGYILIQELKQDDLILTHDNRIVPIIKIFSTIVKGNRRNYPYIIPKNSIGRNYPIEDIKISGNHLIKYRNRWIRPNRHPKFKQDICNKIIHYFHIELPNYETDNLVINNGTVVESLGPAIQNSFDIYKKRIGLYYS